MGVSISAGPHIFRLLVTDSEGHVAASRSPPGPPWAGSCPLPDAIIGTPYSTTLNAVGGSGPHLWTFAGALPEGLDVSIRGLITGTPQASRSFRSPPIPNCTRVDLEPASIEHLGATHPSGTEEPGSTPGPAVERGRLVRPSV